MRLPYKSTEQNRLPYSVFFLVKYILTALKSKFAFQNKTTEWESNCRQSAGFPTSK